MAQPSDAPKSQVRDEKQPISIRRFAIELVQQLGPRISRQHGFRVRVSSVGLPNPGERLEIDVGVGVLPVNMNVTVGGGIIQGDIEAVIGVTRAMVRLRASDAVEEDGFFAVMRQEGVVIPVEDGVHFLDR